jgi:hypothetical protein
MVFIIIRWWDTYKTNDGGVVFDPDIRRFYQNHNKAQLPALPSTFEITTYNPATFHGRGGIKILQLVKPFTKATIQVTLDNEDRTTWVLKTKNVQRFRFNGITGLTQDVDGNRLVNHITVDGCSIPLPTDLFSQEQTFVRSKEGNECAWESKRDGLEYSKTERSPSTYGPARQVFANPFLIVYGSSGTTDEAQANQLLATYVANSHRIASDTRVNIVKDTELTDDVAANFNLVLIGGMYYDSSE